MFMGINDTLLLVALGIGYLVLYFARREEKLLQFVGYIIGATIMVLATTYLVLNIWAYSWIGCSLKPQYRKGIMQQKMKPHWRPQPYLPKELPQQP